MGKEEEEADSEGADLCQLELSSGSLSKACNWLCGLTSDTHAQRERERNRASENAREGERRC
jgi:hypothetical protein